MSRRAVRTGCLGILLSLAMGCGLRGSAQTIDRPYSIRIDGMRRTYSLHIPQAGLHRPAPLLILLHGRLGSGPGTARLTGFDSLAERERFLVAYPEGFEHSWADGRGATPADEHAIDDVAFLTAIPEDVGHRWPVDRSRIYVAGFSNGGFMTERLACAMASQLAGIGIIAATLSDSLVRHCHPDGPVPVMVMGGTDDPLVPFQGGDMGRGRGLVLSVDSTVATWARWNGCSGSSLVRILPDTARDDTTVRWLTFPACPENGTVEAVVVQGGGHTWPGGGQYLPVPVVGKTTRNLAGSETLWAFFARHHR